jgi:hypothetical protein
VSVLEFVTKLRENADFEQYSEWVRQIVEEKRRLLMNPELPDAETPKAKANFLTCLEFANLPLDQEITARRMLDQNDPRIAELTAMKIQ